MVFTRCASSVLLLCVLMGGGVARAKAKKLSRTTSTAAASRIVSLNGTVTEILFALGAGSQVVGRDKSSYYPKSASSLPSVGYQFRLSAEGILRLRPTLVIGTKDVKPKAVIQQIRLAGKRVLLLSKATDLLSSQALIRAVGKAVGKEKRATLLIRRMNEAVARLRQLQQKYKKQPKPKVMFLYVRGRRSRFVLGQQTAIDGMIRLSGAVNAARFRGVRPVSAEGLIAAKPQVIVLFALGLRSLGGLKALKKLPGLALTPAAKHNRFIVMDDLYLGGFGPRCGQAALDLFRGIFEAKGVYVAK